jgi:hypothetical protein
MKSRTVKSAGTVASYGKRVISQVASRKLIVGALALFAEIANAGSQEKPPIRADPFAEWLPEPPFATLELSRNVISIPFPSTDVATQPARLDFVVIGNARTTLTAQPSAHMVDMVDGGMEHAGTIYLVTDPKWAANGGLPLPGTYVGEIVLTLTADY